MINRHTISFVVPFLLIIFIIVLSLSNLFHTHLKSLSLGITIDLVFVIPLIYAFLSNNHNYRLVTMFLFTLGIILASIIIPKEQQFYLKQIKYWVVPVIEILTFTLIFIKIKKTIKEYDRKEATYNDFFTMVKSVSSQILPTKISILLSTEISVFYYGFFYWKRPVFNNSTFSYHKKSSSIAVIAVLIFMILVECTVLHLLLTKWSPKIAWGLSVLSIYTALQVFGMTRAMLKRPIQIIDNDLIVRYGLFSATIIPIHTISEIELSSKELDLNEEVKKISPLKSLENHNTIIRLNTFNHIEGIYGKEKTFKTLLLHIDENLIFKYEIDKKLIEVSNNAQ